jgi:hypothetical protein
MSRGLPPLAHMRTVLRFGMPRDEFFAACDALMENYQLRVGSPALDMNIVSIAVLEGDQLLCFLNDDMLVYVEYQGGIFLDENGTDDTLVPVDNRRRRLWLRPRGCLPVVVASFGLLVAALCW